MRWAKWPCWKYYIRVGPLFCPSSPLTLWGKHKPLSRRPLYCLDSHMCLQIGAHHSARYCFILLVTINIHVYPFYLLPWILKPEYYTSQTPLPPGLSKCDFQSKDDFQSASEMAKSDAMHKRFCSGCLKFTCLQPVEGTGFQALDNFKNSMTLKTTA